MASLQSLGDSYRLAGDPTAAREHLERGLEASRQHALPYFTAHLLASLAAVDLDEGRVDDARRARAEAQQAASADDVPHAGARADLMAGMASRRRRPGRGGPPARGGARHADLDVEADRLESLSVLALALRGRRRPGRRAWRSSR